VLLEERAQRVREQLGLAQLAADDERLVEAALGALVVAMIGAFGAAPFALKWFAKAATGSSPRL